MVMYNRCNTSSVRAMRRVAIIVAKKKKTLSAKRPSHKALRVQTEREREREKKSYIILWP